MGVCWRWVCAGYKDKRFTCKHLKYMFSKIIFEKLQFRCTVLVWLFSDNFFSK